MNPVQCFSELTHDDVTKHDHSDHASSLCRGCSLWKKGSFHEVLFSHLVAKRRTKRELLGCGYLHSLIHVSVTYYTISIYIFFPAQRDNCVSSFRSHYVLIVIIYMLPGGCAIIKMLFESFKRLQLSQAQNLVYIQLLARKSLTAQQFISNGPKKPMHSQKQKCEEKCQPLWYKYWVAFKIWLNNAPGISITVGLWSHL